MKHTHPIQVDRIGSPDVDCQVGQAVANVTLDGLQPSKQSIALTRAVAESDMTTEDAISQLTELYKHKSTGHEI